MTPKLSIIIPCYNSAATLREAVDSCYTQGLTETEFEVLMVDDGSTDTTRFLMETLAHTYTNIKNIYHTENKGGGAARNTGIRASIGNIIYCLDSDNFFAPNTASTMIKFLEENQLDGAVFHHRRFFSGTNHKKFELHSNPLHNRSISLADIFSITGNVLLDNFFFTRISYLRTHGYPENHGFDTQCFELRFLASGNRAQVCPGSLFFHRQDTNHNSYFQRVYKAGYFSRNMYLMCEDIIHLLAPSTRRILMEFNIFQNSKLDTTNLKAVLDQHLIQVGDNFFAPHLAKLLTPHSEMRFLESSVDSTIPEDIFTRAVITYQTGDITKAITNIHLLLSQGTDSPTIYFNLLRYSLTLTNKYSERNVIDEVQKLVSNLTPRTQSLGWRARVEGIVSKTLHTLMK